MTLDLAALPPARRAPVREAYERELAAVRIPGMVDAMRTTASGRRQTLDATYSAVVAALQAEGFGWITERWVRRVDREGR